MTTRYGVRVTTAARTVIDIARATSFMEGVVVADAALYERHVSKTEYDSGERAIAERRRDRLLQEAGFKVVHVTWQELFGDPAQVAGRIREAFRRAERPGLGR